ncbi:MAG: hydrolase [Crocinitomicaceae bacterium]|jgi:8-oxo-dGTP pyrophosphatase MutT (NUDIX family)|nr:hydrolase [Crocinitomicaceae bacterium]
MFALNLKAQLEAGLPGEDAHVRMAPLSRPVSSLAKQSAKVFRESAVTIIIFEDAGEQRILLTQRPKYNGKHSGQVSFPGGKWEEGDLDLLQTAMRECYEETGIRLSIEQYVGNLTPVFIPVSNFHVEAYLFYLDYVPQFQKDEREVEAIFSIRIEELLDENRVQKTNIAVSEEMELEDVPYFDLENKVIWGATALILSELKEILSRIKKD